MIASTSPDLGGNESGQDPFLWFGSDDHKLPAPEVFCSGAGFFWWHMWLGQRLLVI